MSIIMVKLRKERCQQKMPCSVAKVTLWGFLVYIQCFSTKRIVCILEAYHQQLYRSVEQYETKGHHIDPLL